MKFKEFINDENLQNIITYKSLDKKMENDEKNAYNPEEHRQDYVKFVNSYTNKPLEKLKT